MRSSDVLVNSGGDLYRHKNELVNELTGRFFYKNDEILMNRKDDPPVKNLYI